MGKKMWMFLCVAITFASHAYSIELEDQSAIRDIISNYVTAWNQNAGKGFGDHFAEDADFVNIFGTRFSGKAEIEERHIHILKTFLKGSMLHILDTQMREVQPGLIIAHVRWKLTGSHPFRCPMDKPGEIREGIFTQVYMKSQEQWEIIASQNTLIPN